MLRGNVSMERRKYLQQIFNWPSEEMFNRGWSSDHRLFFSSHVPFPGNDRNYFLQYVEKTVVEGKWKYKCTICGKINGQKAHTENHVESIYYSGSKNYNCKHCNK